jgi:hypothetical protein
MKKKTTLTVLTIALVLPSLACSLLGGIVDREINELESTAAALVEEIDAESIEATVDASMDNIDTDSIEETAEAVIEDVDTDSIQATADAAIEGIDIGEDVETEFPLPESVNMLTEVMGTVNFQTDLTMEEAIEFYRQAFADKGYTERELLTSITDGTASLVFDGHESGQAIVLQIVSLGPGLTNISLRFEDL